MTTTTPLVIPSPLSAFGPAASIVSPGAVALALFYLVVFLACLYTLIAAYHWLRYGHRSPLAIPAICIHIFVSLALIGFAATGLP